MHISEYDNIIENVANSDTMHCSELLYMPPEAADMGLKAWNCKVLHFCRECFICPVFQSWIIYFDSFYSFYFNATLAV